MTELDGQTEDFHYTRLMLDFYKAIRVNGGSLDVVGKEADFQGYKLGLNNLSSAVKTMHNILLAHGMSLQALRSNGNNEIGIVLNNEYPEPFNEDPFLFAS